MSTSVGLLLAYGLVLRPGSLPDPEEGDDGPLALMIAEGTSHDGLRIVDHGEEGSAGHLLVIAGTIKRTAIPHPIALTSRLLGQVTAHDVKLKAFARKYKLKIKGEPGWVVAATVT